ncbi:hypothetical protein LshimejAT787_0206790 [Lyophyllum shimeji]|uniref:Uncharacterized protein n=1 Tax=Lyophyllum shimeji TaxID=47721 RepID=A0A9P3PGP0_LYOSH|nr:hypothetical protein LshimejAT787_0206790 [Lyophyllum shimeji]
MPYQHPAPLTVPRRDELPVYPSASWGLPPVDDDLVFPITSLPELYFPPSPSDTSSTSSTDLSSPQSVHVVCNAPLVAPIPLPYHSPRFLQFDLPDIDQDLSHPPYTRRSSKRKRASDDLPDQDGQAVSKKRPLRSEHEARSHFHRRLSDKTSLRHHTTHSKRSRMHSHT